MLFFSSRETDHSYNDIDILNTILFQYVWMICRVLLKLLSEAICYTALCNRQLCISFVVILSRANTFRNRHSQMTILMAGRACILIQHDQLVMEREKNESIIDNTSLMKHFLKALFNYHAFRSVICCFGF